MHLELVNLIVDGYDAAIDLFVDKLRFELVEDSGDSGVVADVSSVAIETVRSCVGADPGGACTDQMGQW